jgi:hypothetical protein
MLTFKSYDLPNFKTIKHHIDKILTIAVKLRTLKAEPLEMLLEVDIKKFIVTNNKD